MIREMFEDMPVISSILTLIILGTIFLFIDGITSKPEFYYGNVIDKHYLAKKHRTGTGFGVTGDGRIGIITTSENEPEKFILMVKTENGDIVTTDCKPEIYYKKEIGQEIEIAIYKGRFTGIDWYAEGIK